MEHKAFKYRIYPTEEQTGLLAQFFGAKRWVFNHYLAEQKRRFSAKEKRLSHFDVNKDITQAKRNPVTEWLRQIDDWCLKSASEDLANSYENFFNSISGKRKGKKMELPRFKKRSDRQSYRTRGIRITAEGLKLPKFKSYINIVLHRPIEGRIKYATVSKTPSGKYFVSILCESEVGIFPSTGREVGIDMGLVHLAITNDGQKFDHPEQMLAKAKQRLKKYQRKMSRKTKGSKRYEKTRAKAAKAYEKITNIRTNYYHNISNYLVTNYDAIYVEDLNVAGMVRNRKLSRKIAESAWATLSSMIEYKCGWYGKTYYRINRWFASTKTCSDCGHKMESMPLSVREWTCPVCGSNHDRDINAAINIRNAGQIDLYNHTIPDATAGWGPEVPMALEKYLTKIERSDHSCDCLGRDEASKPDDLQSSGSLHDCRFLRTPGLIRYRHEVLLPREIERLIVEYRNRYGEEPIDQEE